jgi:hypothetical protein
MVEERWPLWCSHSSINQRYLLDAFHFYDNSFQLLGREAVKFIFFKAWIPFNLYSNVWFPLLIKHTVSYFDCQLELTFFLPLRFSSPKSSVLTRATQRNIPEDGILHNHRRENLKSYKIKAAGSKTSQLQEEGKSLVESAVTGDETLMYEFAQESQRNAVALKHPVIFRKTEKNQN